jgi:uncharacterized protein
MERNLDFSQFYWLNQPARYELKKDQLIIYTDPETDFWQRTYYGFRHDNSHAFLLPVKEKAFTFTVKATWEPKKMFDQCGIALYQNAEHWFKASVEYENDEYSRLGSVVTNLGFSDWATTDIVSDLHSRYYRLSRREQDFCIEQSEDGGQFKQMRILHMHLSLDVVNIGVYACSPLQSSIPAIFSEFQLGECQWELFNNPDLMKE